MRRAWTPEQVEQLELVANDYTRWRVVAEKLGRSEDACKAKWSTIKRAKAAVHKMNVGAWSEEEIESLLSAHDELGEDEWDIIAHRVRSRTVAQCKRKLETLLRPKRHHAAFSKAEMQALETHGVAYCIEMFPYRSVGAWKKAWARLTKKF